ncbi:amino-acid N-acetyltransferase [Thiomicrorhabdus aquaedulcis]|uniref:amino-acid N-acetyltransferase n=1 Tax=Thiomicrorhabdus aquaedulcis TaxID=2211106 RepID=UPI000FDABB27|nr:amino-acid N-acetyltransferase [Thiomicrorhabdus aquaedulcis]
MNQSELDFINTLRQSSGYIEQHRGKTCVIYIPGELIMVPSNLHQLAQDIALLDNLGIKMVLVMGASAQIDHAMRLANMPFDHHHQFRITTSEMLPIFQQTIGVVRSQLEAAFTRANNSQPVPLTVTSGNWVIAQPKGVIDGIDFQHTGRLRKMNHQAISACLNAEQVALLTPLAYSLTGEVFNLNTLEQACAVANSIQADKLMVFASPQQLAGLPKQLSIPQLRHAISQSTDAEQIDFLTQISVTNNRVKRVHLMDEQTPSAILLELFTRDGSGTLIFSDRYHQVRMANIEDVVGILELITPLEQQGVLVKRSRERLELEIANFMIIERDQHIIGCAALYPHADLSGELACLAIHPNYQGQELGEELLNAIEQNAQHQHLKKLFLLTTHTHHWFIEHGFMLSTIDQLPEQKQSLYNFQRQSKVLTKSLSNDR